MGSDLDIVRAARVLPGVEWRDKSDPKLIGYLIKNQHTSPFEHVVFTFYVKAPLFVFRQWHRHRTWSYNEVSARYKELPAEYYVPDPNIIGVQSLKNHQGREFEKVDVEQRKEELKFYIDACEKSLDEYHNLLAFGWPRELARGVLPMAIYSEMYATVDLHNLLHFIKLRSDEHAQYEIREYAEAMKLLITPIVPVTMEAMFG